MKLFINDNPVDLQLQNEKTAYELVKQLDSWLSEQGHALLELAIDGEPCELAADDWRGRALEGIGRLDIQAPNLHQLRLANLSVLAAWSTGLHQKLVDLSNGLPTLPAVAEDIARFEEVRPALFYLADSSETARNDPFLKETERLFEAARQPSGGLESAAIPGLARQVHALMVLSNERINEATQPIREAHLTASILQELMPNLGMVSTQILTGKAREAFDTILQFSELLGKLLRLFWLMLENRDNEQPAPYSRQELHEWARMVNECLNQISDALDRQDTVLLGDLLEYELPEHIQRLINLIPVQE